MYRRLFGAFSLLLLISMLFTGTMTAQSGTVLQLAQTNEALSVEVVDALGLVAIQFKIDFDPTVVTVVEDELQSGDCPSAEFVVANSADNTQGLISYAATQLTSEPCNTGTVAAFSIQCAQVEEATETKLRFRDSILAGEEGITLEHEIETVSIVCPLTDTVAQEATATPQPIADTEVGGGELVSLGRELDTEKEVGIIDSPADEVSLLEIDETDNIELPIPLFVALLGALLLIVVSVAFIVRSHSARTHIEKRLK